MNWCEFRLQRSETAGLRIRDVQVRRDPGAWGRFYQKGISYFKGMNLDELKY